MDAYFYNLKSPSLYFSFLHHRPHLLLLLLLFLLIILPSANSVSFQIARFDLSDTSIICEGGAYFCVGAIELNSDSYMCQVGRATYAEKVPIWDSQTNRLSDFSTHFTFFIDVLASPSYGSGLSFFLAPYGFPIPTNSACDPEWDPPVEHVGINNNSLSSAACIKWNASLHSGDPADVWIIYNATTKNLTVSWKYQTTSSPQENNSLSYIIDLREVLPEWVTIGFSASSRDFVERHVIQSWEFSSSLEIDEAKERSSKKTKLAVGLAVSISVLMAVVIITFSVIWRQKKMRAETSQTTNLTSFHDDLEKGAFPRRLSYNELVLATNSFANDRKLEEGGFGAVYRGYLTNISMAIAVKKISRRPKQGKKEYITEVKIISRLRHRNLVQLMGWCHQRGDFLLVYEFMPNGSLDSHLFGNKAPLPCAVRYRTAIELASALLYLHDEWEKCVVHRDVKSSNIMLDSSFNVKLGDFGLARLMDHELGRASKESDVYSIGVVALEIATGRRAVDPIEPKLEMSLVEWVWDLYGTGKMMSGVDERLGTDFDGKQAERLMIVALWCAQPDRRLRPSIRQAIHVLGSKAALPNLPTKMPVPLYHISSPSSGEPLISHSDIDMCSNSPVNFDG
ncbi:kinase, putative [Ricinus communis]|uniref:Kinase, putative n=1 Tax=Ricinus communis TaxID=3988 RepID=B9SML2_RICCO|nr:kinase, putative [Ricinus communis]